MTKKAHPSTMGERSALGKVGSEKTAVLGVNQREKAKIEGLCRSAVSKHKWCKEQASPHASNMVRQFTVDASELQGSFAFGD